MLDDACCGVLTSSSTHVDALCQPSLRHAPGLANAYHRVARIALWLEYRRQKPKRLELPFFPPSGRQHALVLAGARALPLLIFLHRRDARPPPCAQLLLYAPFFSFFTGLFLFLTRCASSSLCERTGSLGSGLFWRGLCAFHVAFACDALPP